MKRLPGYDRTTNRMETWAFLGLALMALPLVISAVWEAGRFSLEREAIAAALARPAGVMMAGEKNGTNVALQPIPNGSAHQPVVFRPSTSRS
jgi:hypothetical protein